MHWKPEINIGEGLKRTISWFSSNYFDGDKNK